MLCAEDITRSLDVTPGTAGWELLLTFEKRSVSARVIVEGRDLFPVGKLVSFEVGLPLTVGDNLATSREGEGTEEAEGNLGTGLRGEERVLG